MAFIKESFLREKSRDAEIAFLFKKKEIIEYIVEDASEAEIEIFLCHSHKDRELVEGFKYLLAQYGIKVYIDWQDSKLPEIPNKETAERIKRKIEKSDLFILLATNNALSSRWCPWEVGIADGYKGYEYILIIPIKPDDDFKGNEYLQLYKRVEIVDEKLFVLEPEFKEYGKILYEYEIGYRQGILLEDFLKRKVKKKFNKFI